MVRSLAYRTFQLRFPLAQEGNSSFIETLVEEATDLQLEHDKLTQRHATSESELADAVEKMKELL